MNLEIIMDIMKTGIDIIKTGVLGLLSIIVACYIVAMLYQAGRELWRRGRARRVLPLANHRHVETPTEFERVTPLYVKAGK